MSTVSLGLLIRKLRNITLMSHLSCVMREHAFCICENKDADQLCGNRAADQRLCFCQIDRTIYVLPKSEISSPQPPSVPVKAGLCHLGNSADRFSHDTAHFVCRRGRQIKR